MPRWLEVPRPAEAMPIVPGLSFACATSSAKVFALLPEPTTTAIGVTLISATGTKSRSTR